MEQRTLKDRAVRLFGFLGLMIAVGLLVGWTLGISPRGEVEGAAAEEEPTSQQMTMYGAAITPLGNVQVRGFAGIQPAEGGSEIVVDVHGLEPGAEHMQHIHDGGSCSNIGGVAHPLEPYPEADNEGAVHYRQTFETLPDNLGNKIVVIHGADGSPVACGQLDAIRE